MEIRGSDIASSGPTAGQVAEDDRYQDNPALDGEIEVIRDPHQVDAVLDDLDAQHAQNAVDHRSLASEQTGAAHDGCRRHFESERAPAHIGLRGVHSDAE